MDGTRNRHLLRLGRGLVGRDVSPRWGATCAKCARTAAHHGEFRTDLIPIPDSKLHSSEFRAGDRVAAGLSAPTCNYNYTFRATGITTYRENGGRMEVAQQLSRHESDRMTWLYDRRLSLRRGRADCDLEISRRSRSFYSFHTTAPSGSSFSSALASRHAG
jgi:hypothetical protein